MNKLIMWSGGIDSTYVLAKALKETNDRIFVHHIHMMDLENRHGSEQTAVLNLIPKLRSIRDFYYADSTVERIRLRLVYNMPVVCFEAGVAMRHWQGFGYKMDEWTIGTHKSEGHWQERWDIIVPAVKAAYWEDPKIAPGYEEPPPFRLRESVFKIEEIKYLKGLDLYDSCWYCRHPNKGNECGKCKTCIEVDKALIN